MGKARELDILRKQVKKLRTLVSILQGELDSLEEMLNDPQALKEMLNTKEDELRKRFDKVLEELADIHPLLKQR